MRIYPLATFTLLSLLLDGCSSSDNVATAANGGPDAAVDSGDPSGFAAAPLSCVFTCPTASSCAEVTAPYACPSLGAWPTIPHDTSCPAWDGTYPEATPTKCVASSPSGEATRHAGPVPGDARAYILPDGRRVRAAAAEWIFDEPDMPAGLSTGLLAIPGTTLLLVVDTGDGPHAIRVVDASKIGSGASPVLSHVSFAGSTTLNDGIVFIAPNLVLVATDDGHVQALKLDTTSGVLTQDDSRSIPLPPSVNDAGRPANYYVRALVVSPDGKRLMVAPVFDKSILVYDLSPAGYGKPLGAVAIGAGGTYSCGFDPNDASGHFFYCTLWGGASAVEIDTSNAAAPVLARTFAVGNNPQGLAFLDARWLAVSNDFGDSISLVDRASGTVTSLPIDASTTLRGIEPSSLAYDAAAKRLYSTLAGQNAIAAWSVDTSMTPPALMPLGRMPTSWWPSDLEVLPNGALAISSARGHSDGSLAKQFVANDGDAISNTRGGVQLLPAPSAADLTTGDAEVATNNDVAHLAGASQVTCPNAENDFPLPPTNTQGPSPQIKHIVFIVRENKTFDAVLGDVPGADGDPTIMMKSTSAGMDRVWTNFRTLVRTFATSDNYYTDAELSAQGHTWTTFGRSSDFTERTWQLDGYAHNDYTSRVQPQGFAKIGYPEEGSLFDWLGQNQIDYSILGEGLGEARRLQPEKHVALDVHYPGGFVQSQEPDVEKGCYIAGRARVVCDLGSFVYATLFNDHTRGAAPGTPSIDVQIAVNDEATGMVVDALSHSPLWASSLVIVTEDDPAGGGDHIEHHRTPILFASPWIKRGYVSKTHMDVSSLHKMFAHLLGLPYLNAVISSASLPLDLFSSTPDFTPYDYKPRVVPLSCGEDSTLAETILTQSWDFTRADEQPGLGAQVFRYMRGDQLQQLSAKTKTEVATRTRKRALGVTMSDLDGRDENER